MDTIERVPEQGQIRRAYAFWSLLYDMVATPLEHGARMRGVAAAGIGRRDKILEVAAGTGSILREILKRTDPEAVVCGADFSHEMIRKARRSLTKTGQDRASLLEADALQLPFRDCTFDVLINNYMLDLMSCDQIAAALAEFRRVLKPGGRMVLVNMSKADPEKRSMYERIYRTMPVGWAALLLGGCRPVLLRDAVMAAGFEKVQREFVPQAMPSEIIVGRKRE